MQASLLYTLPAVALLVLAIPVTAPGQQMPQELLACASEQEDSRRLACYDRVVGRADDGTTPDTGAPAAVAEAAATSDAPRAAEPAATMDPRVSEAGKLPAGAEERLEFSATVAKVAKAGDGALIVTLDNGQIWKEKYSSTIRIREGDTVTLREGRFGGYSMVGRGRRGSQVTRVQ